MCWLKITVTWLPSWSAMGNVRHNSITELPYHEQLLLGTMGEQGVYAA
jgi:hypothetical protein